jgi:hemolysin III
VELVNTYTHLLPFIYFGAKFLVFLRDKKYLLAAFAASLLFCYGTSSAYHYNNFIGKYSNILNKLDHTGIYILLAGSYLTVCWPRHRRILEQVLLLSLLCGTLLWLIELPTVVKVLTYLAIGWLGIRSLRHNLLIIGGFFYTAGAVIYVINYNWHWVFHLFVLAGSLCHLCYLENSAPQARHKYSLRSYVE